MIMIMILMTAMMIDVNSGIAVFRDGRLHPRRGGGGWWWWRCMVQQTSDSEYHYYVNTCTSWCCGSHWPPDSC